ncbi:uncharacterized protein PV09_01209 [Verruconis gallopava]|uniref:Uncharacterized protein n=1 Tax=Verruconis gallopava TaxID=253628 RepID=A0A0D1XZQ7_9PEZI|nr:uncharacterized protein PV09_01209 [Verruconis gallopava]KIW08291.1 hypothetical protein PV09_01209 [Verruconis gallopava]
MSHFIHSFPGLVRSDIDRGMRGSVTMTVAKVAYRTLVRMIGILEQESNERHIFSANNGRYPQRENGSFAGTGLSAAKGSDGAVGSGCYAVDEHGESRGH